MANPSLNSRGEPKRIFITGATGFIGRVVTELAISQGYTVHGLSHGPAGDTLLHSLGATPIRGSLTTLDVLRQESAKADIVLQLAFIHDFTMDYKEVLRIDAAAMDALAEPLRGTDKPFVITSGTMGVEPEPAGGETAEDAPLSETFPLKDRIQSEHHALRMIEDGVRVSVIRLAPHVYGRSGKGFLTWLMDLAFKAGESVYVDEGNVRTSTLHVDDAAALYLLAAMKAKGGEVFNGTGSTTTTTREIAEAIGVLLNLPVRSVSLEEAEVIWGSFVSSFVMVENRASNRKAVKELGWHPKGVDILTDTRSGSYRKVAEELLQGKQVKPWSF